ncbi:MAG TPA: haloacid dehalogenase type II [Terriglobales bacterium]|nr:haloacid dehalogenase type II [Terriglobales bacterium]
MLDFSQFRALTFDCYGTLIDWETGLLGALRPVLRAHGCQLRDEQILALYAELEPASQVPYRRYREVLQDVVRGFGQRLGFQPAEAEARSLPDSLQNWQPFPDTVPALQRLQTRYRLAIISNIDDDLFAATARHLRVVFDQVITAEQAGAYKPSLAPFQLALERLALPKQQVLHLGQSVYHDVAPAKTLGLASVLVRRRGPGATRTATQKPDLEVPDLQSLASLAVP